MKLIVVFSLFWFVSIALAEDRPLKTKDSFEFHENGERPLGLHIEGEKRMRQKLAEEINRGSVYDLINNITLWFCNGTGCFFRRHLHPWRRKLAEVARQAGLLSTFL